MVASAQLANSHGPSLGRQIATWIVLSLLAGPFFLFLAAVSGDATVVLWCVGAAWTLGTGAALYPELAESRARPLLAAGFGLLCTGVAAAAAYGAVIALIVIACSSGACLS